MSQGASGASLEMDVFPANLWDSCGEVDGIEYSPQGCLAIKMRSNIYFYSPSMQDDEFFKLQMLILQEEGTSSGTQQKECENEVKGGVTMDRILMNMGAETGYYFSKYSSFLINKLAISKDVPVGIFAVLMSNGILFICNSSTGTRDFEPYPVPVPQDLFSHSKYKYQLVGTGIKILFHLNSPESKFKVKTFCWLPEVLQLSIIKTSSSSSSGGKTEIWKNVLPLLTCSSNELFIWGIVEKSGISEDSDEIKALPISSYRVFNQPSHLHTGGNSSICCISCVLNENQSGEVFAYLGTTNGQIYKILILFGEGDSSRMDLSSSAAPPMPPPPSSGKHFRSPFAQAPVIRTVWSVTGIANTNVESIVIPSRASHHYLQSKVRSPEVFIYYSANSIYIADSSSGMLLTSALLAHSLAIVKLECVSKFSFDSISTQISTRTSGGATSNVSNSILYFRTVGLDGNICHWSLLESNNAAYEIVKCHQSNLNLPGESHLRIGSSAFDPSGTFAINLNVLNPRVSLSSDRQVQMNRHLALPHSKIGLFPLNCSVLVADADFDLYFRRLIHYLISAEFDHVSFSLLVPLITSLVIQTKRPNKSFILMNNTFALCSSLTGAAATATTASLDVDSSDSDNEVYRDDMAVTTSAAVSAVGGGANSGQELKNNRQTDVAETILQRLGNISVENFTFIFKKFCEIIEIISFQVAADDSNNSSNSSSSSGSSGSSSSIGDTFALSTSIIEGGRSPLRGLNGEFHLHGEIHLLSKKLSLFRMFRIFVSGLKQVLMTYDNKYFNLIDMDYYSDLTQEAFEYLKIGNILASLHTLFNQFKNRSITSLYPPELQTLLRYYFILELWIKSNSTHDSARVISDYFMKLEALLKDSSLSAALQLDAEYCCICESRVYFDPSSPNVSICSTCDSLSVDRCCFTYQLLSIDFDSVEVTNCKVLNWVCYSCDIFALRAFSHDNNVNKCSTSNYRPLFSWVHMLDSGNLCPFCSAPLQIL